MKLHGMHSMWRRRRRLADHASIIHEIDLSILREGGVDTMTQDEMRSVNCSQSYFFNLVFARENILIYFYRPAS